MPSYQDLETRLLTVERKLDFIMKLPFVTKKSPSLIMPGEFVIEQKSLLDLYHEVNSRNLELVPNPDVIAEETNG